MTGKVLLTGGAGFIATHTYVALHAAGHRVAILDNFENSKRDVPERLAAITGVETQVFDCDVRDAQAVDRAIGADRFDAVMHFAALKSVPESQTDPISYHRINCGGLFNVVAAMQAHGVPAIVFSSTAAVYGDPDEMPIRETTPTSPQNAYAATKLFGEQFLQRVAAADPAFRHGILRYFNPVGAHESGLIGEDPALPPSNLVPAIARVAAGESPGLKVYGGDYDTPDGTGIRDFVHISDLARGHVLSLEALLGRGQSHLVNLGTGKGHSVLDVIRTYERVSGRIIAYEIVDRRDGDAAISFANTTLARELLGFSARHGIEDMCASNWAFKQGIPPKQT